jgi:hypothetical protein
MASLRHTAEVGRKFHADGSPRLFPGNTVIGFVGPDHAVYQQSLSIQDQVRAAPFGAKFSLLPPPSLHMTVMELFCDQVRVPERWSSQLALDAALVETDTFFLARVPQLSLPESIRMRFVRLRRANNLTIDLEPADVVTEQALRTYRQAISAATGVRFPDHDTYQFHISLAYRLIELSFDEQAELDRLALAWEHLLRDQAGIIEPDPPQLVFFDDMFAFVPAAERHRLRSRGGA